MITGSCHCGAVQWRYPKRPEKLTSCNCSYCRRAGGLWAYGSPREIELVYAPGSVIRYLHGDRSLAFVSCANCGCTTHWEPQDPEGDRMAVNFAMAEPAAREGICIRHFDGAETWQFLD